VCNSIAEMGTESESESKIWRLPVSVPELDLESIFLTRPVSASYYVFFFYKHMKFRIQARLCLAA